MVDMEELAHSTSDPGPQGADGPHRGGDRRGRAALARIGLFAGPVLALAAYLLLPEAAPESGAGLSAAGRATAALALWMATWWITEAIPIYATALLPLVALPLIGASSVEEAAAPYGHELIFLFLGGFIVALGLQRWSLHRRIALLALSRVGDRPDRAVGAFMVVTAVLSMWVSNTATAIMMLPIAESVIDRTGGGDARAHRGFAVALLLGIAYGASIGGIGTLIGTPPNLFLASWAERELGSPITFARWMGVGIPIVVIFLPITWWLLTRVLHPVHMDSFGDSAGSARSALAALGPVGRGERIAGAVFAAAALAWMSRPWLVAIEVGGVRPLAGLSDTGIAIGAALSLFVIPVSWRDRVFAMDWETARELPWGVLVLFGGGLSLASALRANGVSDWIGYQVSGLAGAPPILLVAAVAATVILLTELTSNTATTAALIPILGGMAPGLGIAPLELAVPAALAASCAFMLPVATPPNAIVFGSGRVTVPEMARAGVALNVVGVFIITGVTYFVAVRWLVAG
jgi:sodium-dependent dicarboxylate transporter 2/3/5